MPPASSAMPLPTLLSRLVADPGQPRLTWYGPDGERIELSGHVLDNWVTKSTNLLVEEYDVGPQTRVLVDLPPHWRTVVWAMAVWRAGACVVLPDAGTDVEGIDVVVTSGPGAHASQAGVEMIVVALPALARSFDGDLPPGATDAAAAVMTYGDVLTYLPEADPAAPAIEHATPSPAVVPHSELLTWATTTTPAPGSTARPRVLLEPGPRAVADVLAAALVAYAADGSVVLCSPDVAAELAADPGRRARLVDSERVTGS